MTFHFIFIKFSFSFLKSVESNKEGWIEQLEEAQQRKKKIFFFLVFILTNTHVDISPIIKHRVVGWGFISSRKKKEKKFIWLIPFYLAQFIYLYLFIYLFILTKVKKKEKEKEKEKRKRRWISALLPPKNTFFHK